MNNPSKKKTLQFLIDRYSRESQKFSDWLVAKAFASGNRGA